MRDACGGAGGGFKQCDERAEVGGHARSDVDRTACGRRCRAAQRLDGQTYRNKISGLESVAVHFEWPASEQCLGEDGRYGCVRDVGSLAPADDIEKPQAGAAFAKGCLDHLLGVRLARRVVRGRADGVSFTAWGGIVRSIHSATACQNEGCGFAGRHIRHQPSSLHVDPVAPLGFLLALRHRHHGGQVHDSVNARDRRCDGLRIADGPDVERRGRRHIGSRARRQVVQHTHRGTSLDQAPRHMAANEPSSTGHQNGPVCPCFGLGAHVAMLRRAVPTGEPADDACGSLRCVELRLHNTLSGRKEAFTPLDPDGRTVTFYSCGPTVYDYAHIGNFRSFLNADMLRRTLELVGYDVRHVMNITDVGHMTDDAVADGGGEDKMEVAARRLADAKKSGEVPEGADVDPSDPMAIADFYAEAFLDDARMLGLGVAMDAAAHPERLPRPTQYVDGMIEMVQSLIERGHAYVASDGAVYFDVLSWPDYGELSGNTIGDLRSGEGGRVDMATQSVKKHPADFMLWKPDQTHLMRWPSPWGEGYPGWHLECSVMARGLLGEQIDIHSGGEDNIFPHHECEIAQSRGTTGCDHFAQYWFHTRHLMVDGAKMSKSSGTFFTIRDLLERGASPAAIRLELVRTHYRINANFTLQGLRDAQRQVERWDRVRAWLEEHAQVSRSCEGPLTAALPDFTAALCDDLNVAGAIGTLNTAIGALQIEAAPEPGEGGGTWADELAALHRMDSVLGVLDLDVRPPAGGSVDEDRIAELIAARDAAREGKDWLRADELRDELLEMGIAIKDGAVGTTWERVVQ